MKFPKQYLTNIPLVALLAANSIPLFGVLFFGWDAFYIVLLYWSENLVIGFYNVLKLICVEVPHPSGHLPKLFFIPFFTVHYGGFMAVHGIFVMSMFKKGSDLHAGGQSWPCFFVFLEMLLNVLRQMCATVPLNMKLALLALFASHGVSFVYNYLWKEEFAKAKLDKLMSQPYGRIVVMHIAILGGGFLSMSLGSPLGLLLVLVVLKTVLDVKLHLREHKLAIK